MSTIANATSTARRPSLPRILAACGLALALGGCSLLGSGGSREPGTIYSPDVRVQPDPAWPSVQWQLAIASASATRMVDSPRISVRPTASELQVYGGASWSQPSTDLLETTVLRAFEDSGRIHGVARSDVGIRPDYKLVMDIRRFEADYAGRAVPSATIEVSAKLLHNRDQRVVASRTFLQEQPAAGTAVPQVVAAFEQALAGLSTDIVGWTLAGGQADHLAPDDPLTPQGG